MKGKRIQLINIAIIGLAFIESIWAYTRLPEKVASHWDAAGQVNGYMGKFGGAFFMPLLTLSIFILFSFVPKIDPRNNIAKFKDIFNIFITVFLLYMLYIHTLSIAFNLGHTFDFTRAILPSMGVLFYFIGWMLPRAEPNWFIGIRTPWTLSSDIVWEKTHELGGKLYKIAGVLTLIGFIVPKYAFLFVLIPIIVVSIYLVVYSYIEFTKTVHSKK